MHKTLLALIVTLTLFATGAIAQRRFPPSPPHRPGAHHPSFHHERKIRTRLAVKAYANVLSGNVSTGAVGRVIGVAFGGEYERFLDRRSNISIAMPVAGFIGGFVNFDSYDYGDTRPGNYGVYIAPGLRYHPSGNKKRFDPAIGIALGLGSYHQNDLHLDYGGRETKIQSTSPLVALLFHAGVNIHSSGGFMFGIYASGGPMLTGDIPGGAMLQIGVKACSGF